MRGDVGDRGRDIGDVDICYEYELNGRGGKAYCVKSMLRVDAGTTREWVNGNFR